ncbi:hypothetical protein RDI58_018733 [Solanum bulbocastanum]|uniref:Uncharacterized protein n=1 Tax=Solanum bulbocastanum TaxID=147425 RepID=A0AAN8YDB7_SOLBU
MVGKLYSKHISSIGDLFFCSSFSIRLEEENSLIGDGAKPKENGRVSYFSYDLKNIVPSREVGLMLASGVWRCSTAKPG